MKKVLLTSIVCLLYFTAKSQNIELPIDSTTKLITFQNVVQVPEVSKDDLYNRAREWFAKTFRSANSVLQMDDKPSGKLIGKGNAKGNMNVGFGIITQIREDFTVSVTVKDGRYRYEVTDFAIKNLEASAGSDAYPVEIYLNDPRWKNKNNEYKRIAREGLTETKRIALELVTSLTSAMNTATSKSKDDF